MRRLIASLAAAVGLATAAFTVAPVAASASTTPLPTARGHVALAGPLQYAKFDVHTHTSNHGWFNYTNFESPASGTHVWNISKASSLTFTLGGSTYAHTMNVTSVKALSPYETRFAGTGHYNADPTTTWSIKGVVNSDALSFSIVYTGGTDAGYWINGHGLIAADGSVSGTAVDRNGNTPGFTMPAGSAFPVLHYRATVAGAIIRTHNARFQFTIPASAPAGLAGLNIVVKVHDGGTPGRVYDTYGHGVATGWLTGPVTYYPITSGNIVVHR
jgi:hypothetical protein